MDRRLTEILGKSPPSESPWGNLPPKRTRKLRGRRGELAEALSIVRLSNNCTRLQIVGTQGVGKTSIALELIHALDESKEYESTARLDCQSEVFSRGALQSSPAAIRDVPTLARELAFAIDDSLAIRAKDKERIPLLRQRIAHKKILVVADNLEGSIGLEMADFLWSLPSRADVVVTTAIDLGWTSTLRLSPLGRGDGATMLNDLTRNVRISPEMAERIADACEGLPLAISYAANMLNNGVPEILVLETAMDHPGALSDYLYQRRWRKAEQNPEQQDLLIQVADTPGILRREQLLEICALRHGKTKTASAFSSAVDDGWIDHAAQHISILPAARSYLLGKAGRMGRHHKHLILDRIDWLTENQLALESRSRWSEIFAAMDANASILIDVLNRAKESRSRRLTESASNLATKVGYYLYCRGYWSELLDSESWAGRFAIEHGDLDQAIDTYLVWAAAVRRQRGDATAMVASYDATLLCIPKRERSLSPYRERLWLTHQLSRGKARSPVLSVGYQALENAERLKAINDLEWAARTFTRAGNIFADLGMYELAARSFEDAGRIAESSSTQKPWRDEHIGLAMGNRGILHSRQGEFEMAYPLLIGSRERLVQEPELGTVSYELARAAMNLGNSSDARRHFQDALRLRRKFGIESTMCESSPGWDLMEGLVLA